MTTGAPLPLTYHGEGEFRAPPRFAAACDRAYVIGEQYRMGVQEERSGVSHRHFFARVHDLWLNLPDGVATQFTTSETLRKHALIMTGWHKERRLALSSPAEARRVAAFLMGRQDEYALVSVAGCIVIERTARSQSTRADGMRKAEFQRSKTDVLEWIEALIAEAHSEVRSPSIAPTAEREPVHA